MTTETCSHQHCKDDRPISKGMATYKWSPAHDAVVPFHTGCAHAHPNYDVSKGLGSPFTTITRKVA